MTRFYVEVVNILNKVKKMVRIGNEKNQLEVESDLIAKIYLGDKVVDKAFLF